MTEVTIKARHNGPFLVTGPFTLTDADGAVYEVPDGNGVVLCRCGRSRNKPFCDKSHREFGFAAPERVSR
jgi:CDGSH-type Zn-finger protein